MTYEIWKYSVQAQKQTRFPANENTHELDYGIFLNLFNVPNDPSAAYDVFTHTHTKETDWQWVSMGKMALSLFHIFVIFCHLVLCPLCAEWHNNKENKIDSIN